jgi:hypothetical protein
MDLSWPIFWAVLVINACYIGFMHLLQTIDKSLPPRHSLIPGTNQKFLYMEDFYVLMAGDLFGLPLVMNAFLHLVLGGYIKFTELIVLAVIAVLAGIFFALMCLGEKHKPDMGYPKIGKISPHGVSHLPYFGVYVAASASCLWHMYCGEIGNQIIGIAFFGVGIYVSCFYGDIKAGHFEPLKLIPKNGDLEITVTLEEK